MPVIGTERHDSGFTITAEFDAPVERVWQLWADPRQLERWWGPPGYPATFVRHDFAVPGMSIYWMPGESGEQNYAGWEFVSIDPPVSLVVDNGFADQEGRPAGDLAWNRFTVGLEAIGTGTRMTITAGFDSPEHAEQMISLGMLEGSVAALGQADAILAEGG